MTPRGLGVKCTARPLPSRGNCALCDITKVMSLKLCFSTFLRSMRQIVLCVLQFARSVSRSICSKVFISPYFVRLATSSRKRRCVLMSRCFAALTQWKVRLAERKHERTKAAHLSMRSGAVRCAGSSSSFAAGPVRSCPERLSPLTATRSPQHSSRCPKK